jgi:xanthine dehydrogenase YagS FAD-binding subunit
MFHTLAAGELVKAIVLPPPTPNAYVEIRHKQSFDWALASAAVAQAADGSWRIVLGGVAPAPWRATDAEKALGREPLNENRIRAAAEAAVARAKPLSGNAYKVRLAKVAVGRALRKAAGGDK